MYQTKKTYIQPNMLMADLIFENPSLLLLMEHFEIDFIVHDKTVSQICNENNINTNVFISFCNLFNGFNLVSLENYQSTDILSIIKFLKNCHYYYKKEKYPEILSLIKDLYTLNNSDEIKLVEKFFIEYFNEVSEHLNYEDEIAFPYFCEVANASLSGKKSKEFSVKEYRDHHTDIETKLSELRNLLLKHISIKNDRIIRRKLLFSLFELEFDLNIHSLIEEKILIPLINKIELKN